MLIKNYVNKKELAQLKWDKLTDPMIKTFWLNFKIWFDQNNELNYINIVNYLWSIDWFNQVDSHDIYRSLVQI